MSRSVTVPKPLAVLSTVLSQVAGALLLVLVVLTVADVLGRSLRDQSILGTVDISIMLLVAVAFLGLAAAEIDGRHVVVDLVESRLKPQVRVVLGVVRTALLVALGALLTWGLTEVFFSAVERGETTNDILRLPTWPAKLVLLVSFALFFVVAVWTTVLETRAIKQGKDVPPSWAEAAAVDLDAAVPTGTRDHTEEVAAR